MRALWLFVLALREAIIYHYLDLSTEDKALIRACDTWLHANIKYKPRTYEYKPNPESE